MSIVVFFCECRDERTKDLFVIGFLFWINVNLPGFYELIIK